MADRGCRPWSPPALHSGGKIWFAQMLRGLAALLVVIDHLVLMFWLGPGISTRIAHVAPLPPDAYDLVVVRSAGAFLADLHVSLGALGVAIFFLISGFVIPMSLERYRPLQFLAARGLRILPTWFMAVSIAALVIWMVTEITGSPYPIGTEIWREGLLINDFFAQPYVNPVGWTLAVEVKFYLLCALIVAFSSMRRARMLVGIAAWLVLASIVARSISEQWLPINVYLGVAPLVLGNVGKFIIMMFLGVAFYNHFRGFWSISKFLIIGALLVALSFLAASWAPDHQFWRYACLANLIALLIFGLAYLLRERIPYCGPLNVLAEISFPLYAVHQVAGFGFMTWMYSLHPVPYLNILEGIIFVLLMSWLLHKLVESPSHELGKRIARGFRIRALPIGYITDEAHRFAGAAGSRSNHVPARRNDGVINWSKWQNQL